jgi:hypothetical protein
MLIPWTLEENRLQIFFDFYDLTKLNDFFGLGSDPGQIFVVPLK